MTNTAHYEFHFFQFFRTKAKKESELNPSQRLFRLLLGSIPEKDLARDQFLKKMIYLFRTPWRHILTEKSKCHFLSFQERSTRNLGKF